MKKFVLIGFLVGLVVGIQAQSVYSGLYPYLTGHNSDTAVGIIIDNSGTGYAGGYFIRATDTLKTHIDTDGDAVIYFGGNIILDATYTGVNTHSPEAPLQVAGRIYQSGLGGSTFVGYEAGKVDDLSDNYNTAVGYRSLRATTTGVRNTATGYFSLYTNTIGSFNIASGSYSLYNNTTGNNNTVSGYAALYYNTTGSSNTAIGYRAGFNSTGSDNIFIGDSAGYNETGSDKLYIENSNSATPLIYGEFDNDLLRINGTLQIRDVAEGSSDTILIWKNDSVQYSVDYSTDTCLWEYRPNGDDTIAPKNDVEIVFFDGVEILTDYWTHSVYNTFIGIDVVGNDNLTDGDNNTAYGFKTLYDLTKGDYNTAIGGRALEDDTTGSNNTSIGYASGYSLLSGDDNTAIGYQSLYDNETGSENTMIGVKAGRSNLGSGNIFVGFEAGYSETGSDKLYIDNSNSSEPLIYGEFDNDLLKVNGTLQITDVTSSSSDSVLVISNDSVCYNIINMGLYQLYTDTTTVDATRWWVEQNYDNYDYWELFLDGAIKGRIYGNPESAFELNQGYGIDITYSQSGYLPLRRIMTFEVDTTQIATSYDVSLKQDITDTTTVDATRWWVGQQGYLTDALQWSDTSNQLATDYDLSLIDTTLWSLGSNIINKGNYNVRVTDTLRVLGALSDSKLGHRRFGVISDAYIGDTLELGSKGILFSDGTYQDTKSTGYWIQTGSDIYYEAGYVGIDTVPDCHLTIGDGGERTSVHLYGGDRAIMAQYSEGDQFIYSLRNDGVTTEILFSSYDHEDAVYKVFMDFDLDTEIFLFRNGIDSMAFENTGDIVMSSSVDGFYYDGSDNVYIDSDILLEGYDDVIQIGGDEVLKHPLLYSYVIGNGGGSLSHTTANTGYYNNLFGHNAGDAIITGAHNSCFGNSAGASITIGVGNALFGTAAGSELIDGDYNMFLGYSAGHNMINGDYNVYIGTNAGMNHDSSSYNVLIGYEAGEGAAGTNADKNIMIGYRAGCFIADGDENNIMIGANAGYTNTGANNIFIGYNAAYNETGSNLLYIENTDSSTPLIHGNFATDKVTINDVLILAERATKSTSPVEGELNYINDTAWIYVSSGWKYFTLN